MEEVTLDKKKYVKAADIAKHLGYTSDYVGQLCRAEKVDARLVGRSWFVVADSLRAHQKDTKRSSKAKSTAAVKQYKKAHVAAPASTETYKSTRHISVHHYESDEADLFPRVKRVEPQTRATEVKPHQEVEAPAAVPIKITKQSTLRTYAPAEREPVQFAGTVAITEASTAPEVVSSRLPKVATQTAPTKATPAAPLAADPVLRKRGRTSHIKMQSSDEESVVPVHVGTTSKSPKRHHTPLQVVGQFALYTIVLAGVAIASASLTLNSEVVDGQESNYLSLDFTHILDEISSKI